MKKCNKCLEIKPFTEFRWLRKNKNGSDLYKSMCNPCYNTHYRTKYHTLSNDEKKARQKRDRARWSHEKRKDYNLKRKFGISLDDFNGMLDGQNNACYICSSDITKDAKVDHCHKTGEVRKLLCHNCNTGIGLLKEDITVLENCIKYLREHDCIY